MVLMGTSTSGKNLGVKSTITSNYWISVETVPDSVSWENFTPIITLAGVPQWHSQFTLLHISNYDSRSTHGSLISNESVRGGGDNRGICSPLVKTLRWNLKTYIYKYLLSHGRLHLRLNSWNREYHPSRDPGEVELGEMEISKKKEVWKYSFIHGETWLKDGFMVP